MNDFYLKIIRISDQMIEFRIKYICTAGKIVSRESKWFNSLAIESEINSKT